MTLGDVIKNYRTNYNMSMDMFAKKSGISKAYISLLEKNKHPKTGKSIAPSIQCIKQAAEGMDMDFHVLFEMIDGNVSLTAENEEPTLTPKDNRDIANILFILNLIPMLYRNSFLKVPNIINNNLKTVF